MPFNKVLIERLSRGSIQERLNQETLKSLLVPKLYTEVQNEVKEKLSFFYMLKQQSKFLLEIAKTGVEKAIETTEEDALKWVNAEIEKLGVTLEETK